MLRSKGLIHTFIYLKYLSSLLLATNNYFSSDIKNTKTVFLIQKRLADEAKVRSLSCPLFLKLSFIAGGVGAVRFPQFNVRHDDDI